MRGRTVRYAERGKCTLQKQHRNSETHFDAGLSNCPASAGRRDSVSQVAESPVKKIQIKIKLEKCNE